ncbi:carboxylesterase/lipase family protein [Actinomadura rifamycini]|uniref:carboxylesterase/lipase family protein n=1 Tax=Actinomadura rifamycini TaxID=31962 RepID=UPI000417408D|nr:carboxylesterase family protein [Actinomadura rifamycini]
MTGGSGTSARRGWRAALGLAMAPAVLAAVAACAATPSRTSASGGDGAVVATDKGKVRGVQRDGYREFLGVPFAAPPTGDRRWTSPAPHAPWPGVRDATAPGERCAQEASSTGTPASRAEDCLYLNVTAPDSASSRGPKPVMVWLHGGGFVEGSGGEYDPHRLAVQGDVVVVTVNYRLGVFGNFGHPGLDGSGSFALQDQQAALRWVRRNARAFGGDPGNLTLFGQSAGGQSVCAHLASPQAAGLFDRAIVQSSFCTRDIPANLLAPGLPNVSPWEAPESLAARGRQAAAQLGCGVPSAALDCLRRLPADRLMQVFGQFAGLSYGSRTLPDDPRVAFRTGRFAKVPVMSGTTRDETTYIQAVIDRAIGPLTAAQYRRYLAQAFGGRAGEVAARYPLRRGRPPSRTWAAVTTDSGLACPTLERNRLMSRHVPVYAYEFADRTAPPTLPDVGYPYGAYHSADAFYLFDLRPPAEQPELGPAQRRLADRMVRYWTAFARTGDPNGKNLPHWKRLRPGAPNDNLRTLTTEPLTPEPVDFSRQHKCDFWL